MYHMCEALGLIPYKAGCEPGGLQGTPKPTLARLGVSGPL